LITEQPPFTAPFTATPADIDALGHVNNAAGKTIVSANTTWAMLDKASGRLIRVPNEGAAPFIDHPSST
jgi:acyl-CoA thioester hydrolase